MKRIVLPAPTAEQQPESHESQPHAPATPAAVGKTPSQREKAPARQGQELPPVLAEVLVPSLKVGASFGACGLFAGAAAGIIRSAPPVLFSAVAGVQWFTLASSYYASRQVGLKYLGADEPTPRDKLKASTVAGGVAGTLGGLLRGPRNVIPGAVMFSLFGAGGQAIANWRAERVANAPPAPQEGFWSRWSPVTPISDQDYEKILEERLLRVEADIALINDRIQELREAESRKKDEQRSTTSSSKA